MTLPIIRIKSCPKGYCRDLDKAVAPETTLANVKSKLQACGQNIYAGSVRVDTGRLDIPVYLGLCGHEARQIMPTRKQMGKGSSPAQAEASAIMELMERYAFFSFWENPPHVIKATWEKAEQLFGKDLIPAQEILKSVNDPLNPQLARNLLNLVEWLFYPATNLGTGQITWLPIDWFKMLGEFNGSSAGNTVEESILQGISELVERHASALVDKYRPELPTIDPASCGDPVLNDLITKFKNNGINLIMKDISLGMPLPVIAALAWDPANFPENSEIVFTAGAATSPEKAAIRAITEVAQLGGDFCTKSCYEASGLPKFTEMAQIEWLMKGPKVALSSLPNASNDDIGAELLTTVFNLAPINIYAIETSNPEINVPAHYCIGPGLEFRERDKNQSLGLFIGRKLAEEADPDAARAGLNLLASAYPDAHFLPFFEGLILLREGHAEEAARQFEKSIPLQPDPDSGALAAFYAGYSLSQAEKWLAATPFLEKALSLSPVMKEAANLLGVVYYKQKDFRNAEKNFNIALKIDKGSAMDLANRGIARKMLGKNAEAKADLEAALELAPELEFAKKHLAELE